MSRSPDFEYAQVVQKKLREYERSQYRSPDVPFVPKPPPSGWQDLESDIAELFDSLTPHSDVVEETLWQRALEKYAANRERRTEQERLGLCTYGRCSERFTRGKYCKKHADENAARVQRWRRSQTETPRARQQRLGLCGYWRCPEKPTRGKHCQRHADENVARVKRWKARQAEKRAAAEAFKRLPIREQQRRLGLCTYGRCPDPPTRGSYCQKHAEENVARVKRWQARAPETKRCRDCTDLATRGIYCVKHADRNVRRAREYTKKRAAARAKAR